MNANFGSAHPPFNFYRSKTTLDFDSATADVNATRNASGTLMQMSASTTPPVGDLNETSAAYSAYNIGVVYAGSESLTSVTVTPESLTLTGGAHWAINLWFDTNGDGEYFAWQSNNPDYLTSLGAPPDQYAIGVGSCRSNDPTVPVTCPPPPPDGHTSIGLDTELFLIPGGCPGNTTTLRIINMGGCAAIPPNTHTAMWVGIDIAQGRVGSGSATVQASGGCRSGHGDGDFEDRDGQHHHGQFHGNSCDNGGSSAQDDDNSGNHFQSTSVASSTFTADANSQTLTMIGIGLDNGIPVGFTLVAIDYGGAAADAYNLTLTDGRTVIGTLVSGSVLFD
ncbi:MAG: hypothetical protein E6I85_06615 [Chloroflexi bacterium]|nr:MAG: hypothetical protein E6I85_06615 [Chloroflexota bacterium]